VSENLIIDLDWLPVARPQTIFANGSRTTLGGTSAGKALNLRSLGAEVVLRTVVGRDDVGDRVAAQLADNGVRVLADVDPAGSTERHVNLMAHDGGRVSIYLSAPPVAASVTTAAVEAMLAADAVVIDLSDHARPLLREAVGNGRQVWCDVHDYDGMDPFHAEFVASASRLFASADRIGDPRDFMANRLAAGAELVVCTRGAAGALAATADGRWFDVPAVAVPQVVDTNGAGDAFFAGFLSASLAGAQTEGALAAAAAHAARCVQSPGLV